MLNVLFFILNQLLIYNQYSSSLFE